MHKQQHSRPTSSRYHPSTPSISVGGRTTLSNVHVNSIKPTSSSLGSSSKRNMVSLTTTCNNSFQSQSNGRLSNLTHHHRRQHPTTTSGSIKQPKTGLITSFAYMSSTSSASTDAPKASPLATPELYKNAVIIDPRNGQPHKYTVFFLHGLGDAGSSFVDVFEMLNLPNTRVILPNSGRMPVTCNGGFVMPAWFDIYKLGAARRADDRQDEEGIEASAQRIIEAVDYEVDKLGGDSKKVFLGGFSQGSAMSIHVGFRYPKPLGGIVAASGYALMAYHKDKFIHENSKDTPILIYHGTQDDILPIEFARQTRDYLKEMGINNITYHEEDGMGHHLTNRELREIKNFYDKHMA